MVKMMKGINVHNVPDFKDCNGLWVGSYCPQPYVTHHTRATVLWHNLNKRCNRGAKGDADYTMYTRTINEFTDFQEFAEWCQDQYGYKIQESTGKFWNLDKDLLALDGKSSYSPDTCIFVPSKINTLLCNRGSQSLYPIGVDLIKGRNKFRARCKNAEGKEIHLGYFWTPIEAHRAWQTFKVNVIKKIVEDLADIQHHTALKEVLRNAANNISNDIATESETFKLYGRKMGG